MDAELIRKKEYLNAYRTLSCRIEARLEEAVRLRNTLYPGATVLTGMPSGGSRSADDRLYSVLDRLDRIGGQIAEETAELERRRAEIARTIGDVPDEHKRALLELRYIDGMSWRRIAERMHYSENHVYFVHIEALKLVRIPEVRSES